jgi:hypothetical protein
MWIFLQKAYDWQMKQTCTTVIVSITFSVTFNTFCLKGELLTDGHVLVLLQRATFEYHDPVSLGQISHSMAMSPESEAHGLQLLNEGAPGCPDAHYLLEDCIHRSPTIDFQ